MIFRADQFPPLLHDKPQIFSPLPRKGLKIWVNEERGGHGGGWWGGGELLINYIYYIFK